MAKIKKPAKPQAKADKTTKNLSPLEKARLARKNGTSKPKAKKNVMVFKAPGEVKSFFMRVSVMFDRDGLMTDMKAVRIKGSPTNENAKSVDMALLDPTTMRRLAVRYAGKIFVQNQAKRLPAKSVAQMLMRVSINKDTRAIKVSMKNIALKLDGDKKAKELNKEKDAQKKMLSLLKRPARFLAPAFTKVVDFPSAADLKALLKSQDE